jgi:predicted PurR-regulated permease PerM
VSDHREESTPVDPAYARARAVTAHYAPAESRALGVMAILATMAILWVLLPVGIGVVIGTLLAFTMHHTSKVLVRRTRRPVLVPLGLTAAAATVVTGAIGAFLYLLILQGVSVLSELPRTSPRAEASPRFIGRRTLHGRRHVRGRLRRTTTSGC